MNRLHHHGSSGAGTHMHDVPAIPEHMPLPAEGEGCLEILADRLRARPGIVAIEADFKDSTLTVRYQPTRVSPEELNALADEVAALGELVRQGVADTLPLAQARGTVLALFADAPAATRFAMSCWSMPSAPPPS